MSMKETGQQCVACKAYLFEDDDVVYCPECGAPHHRACYAALGQCACAEKHGTEAEYTVPPKAAEAPVRAEAGDWVQCRMCGEKYDRKQRCCPVCATPNMEAMGGAAFDFLGGIPAEMNIGDGITAEEAKRYVIANTPRYIPKFAAMQIGHKVSWNWLAFLLPSGWLCSRKMWRNGIIIGLLTVAFTLLTVPFSTAVSSLMSENAEIAEMTSMQLSQYLTAHLTEVGMVPFALAAVGGLLNMAMRVLMGLFGDYIYYRHSLTKIAWIRRESEDAAADYRRLGGVSLWGLLLGTFAVQWLPVLLEKWLP